MNACLSVLMMSISFFCVMSWQWWWGGWSSLPAQSAPQLISTWSWLSCRIKPVLCELQSSGRGEAFSLDSSTDGSLCMCLTAALQLYVNVNVTHEVYLSSSCSDSWIQLASFFSEDHTLMFRSIWYLSTSATHTRPVSVRCQAYLHNICDV